MPLPGRACIIVMHARSQIILGTAPVVGSRRNECIRRSTGKVTEDTVVYRHEGKYHAYIHTYRMCAVFAQGTMQS